MSDEPRKRTATEAMRLRPRASVAGAQVPTPEAVAAHRAETQNATEQQLAERVHRVLELHRRGELIDYCLECLLPHPCATYRAAAGDPPHTDTPEDASQ